jgi:ribosomal protein S18 acetylase RimI-like enzyme
MVGMATRKIEVFWPTGADDRVRGEVHRLLHDVVEIGGAIGYLTPPTRSETDAWLDGILRTVEAGDGALALALVDGRVEAAGLWRRKPGAVFAHSATVEKVMAHPSARGLGLGRLIVGSLIDHARDAGLETLDLGLRGNNHGAMELYESLGFREWGRLPDVIEVGDDRFDDVRLFLRLGRREGIRSRGSQPGGPGSSLRRRNPGGALD